MYSGEYDEAREYEEFGENTVDEYDNVATVDEIVKFEARSQMGLGRVRNDDLRSQVNLNFRQNAQIYVIKIVHRKLRPIL
jgi:hypothetical protein